MAITRRIFVSMSAELPRDSILTERRKEFKEALIEKIKRLRYTPESFSDPQGARSLVAGKSWSRVEVDRVLRRCIGAVIVGLPQWRGQDDYRGAIRLATEYCHYDGAVAYTLGLPTLTLVEEEVERRVLFEQPSGVTAVFPRDVGPSWLATDAFLHPFGTWRKQLTDRRDLFLGYSSSSQGVASNLKRFVEHEVGATVLDWRIDFVAGGSILDQIQQAAARCSGGIFLFTKDDIIDGHAEQAAPRDNVVFESGYFINAKGKERVLIVREQGSKYPADLGGDIYATLEDRSNIDPIKDQVRRFLERRL